MAPPLAAYFSMEIAIDPPMPTHARKGSLFNAQGC